MTGEIRRGRRFLHKRSLDVSVWPERKPQLCQITARRHGVVYYGHVLGGDVSKGVWKCDESYFLAESLGSWQD